MFKQHIDKPGLIQLLLPNKTSAPGVGNCDISTVNTPNFVLQKESKQFKSLNVQKESDLNVGEVSGELGMDEMRTKSLFDDASFSQSTN